MNTVIVKLFLYAYPWLTDLAEASEVAAENKAALSFSSPKSPLDVCSDVAEEIIVADRLIMLREQLDLVLGDLSEEKRFLLEYKYFRRKKVLASFADMMPAYSARTYFRKQNALLYEIRTRLMFLGWTDERYTHEFENYAPFAKLYRILSEGRECSLHFKRAEAGVKFQNSGRSASGGEDLRLPFKTKAATATAATQAIQIATICTAESPLFCPPSPPPSTDPDGTLK